MDKTEIMLFIRKNQMDGQEIESYGQGYVYSNRYIIVCFEIRRGGYEYGTEHKTRSAQNTERQTGREESIHTQHKLIESGNQIRNVREGDRGYHYWYSAKHGWEFTIQSSNETSNMSCL